jgi:hypothetical protein
LDYLIIIIHDHTHSPCMQTQTNNMS